MTRAKNENADRNFVYDALGRLAQGDLDTRHDQWQHGRFAAPTELGLI